MALWDKPESGAAPAAPPPTPQRRVHRRRAGWHPTRDFEPTRR